MVNVLKISILITLLLFISIIFKIDDAKAASADEQIEYFKKYGGAFVFNGRLGTNTTGGFKAMDSFYLAKGHAIFGTPSDYSIAPGSWGDNPRMRGQNNFNEYTHRYLGLTYKGYFPFMSNAITEDFDTDGETGSRRYADWRNSSIGNSVQPNHSIPWNEPSNALGVINTSNPNPITPERATALYKEWIDNFIDHYAVLYVYRNAPSFSRTEPYDLFKSMSFEKKRKLAHILQPPTSITQGRFIEWHAGICRRGHCYDGYNIEKVGGDDFVATDLILTKMGTSVNVKFVVTYTGKEPRTLTVPAIDEYIINVSGSSLVVKNSLFPIYWEPNVPVTVDLGDFDIGVLAPSDKVTVTAMYNYDGGVEENTLSNNSLTRELKGSDPRVCEFGGRGEAKEFEDMYCARTATSCGQYGCYTYCAEYKCRKSTYNLIYTIDTLSDPSRQDLMGVWSSNTYGHKNLSVPYASESEPSNEVWRKRITSHNVPGISSDKLKRVIRAGRSLQLYGTLKFEVYFESFKGESDLNNKVNKFVESLKKNLEVHGEDMGDGVVKNNENKTKDTGQLDVSRTKVNGKYIKYEEETMAQFTRGSAGHIGCKVIDIYHKKYKFEIPIKSKNIGGAQQTGSAGEYKTSKSYNVQSKDTDYYTDINTLNGVHGLKLQLKVVGSDIDSAMSASKLCYTEAEPFGIQGNIYDDVRVEDVTDEEKGKNNFNF